MINCGSAASGNVLGTWGHWSSVLTAGMHGERGFCPCPGCSGGQAGTHERHLWGRAGGLVGGHTHHTHTGRTHTHTLDTRHDGRPPECRGLAVGPRQACRLLRPFTGMTRLGFLKSRKTGRTLSAQGDPGRPGAPGGAGPGRLEFILPSCTPRFRGHLGGTRTPDLGRPRALEPSEVQPGADLSHREVHREGQGRCHEQVQGGLSRR